MLLLIGWLLLWFRPSWRYFAIIGLSVASLGLAWSFATFVQNGALKVGATASEIAWALATRTNVGWGVAVFAVVGVVIVLVRAPRAAARG